MTDSRVEQIVVAFKAAVTGLTTTGARVYRGRTYSLQSTEVPALLIYQGADHKVAEFSQTLVDRRLTVFAEAVVKSASVQVETTANLILKELTIALQANYTLGLAFVRRIEEMDIDEPQLSGDGDQPTTRLRQAWDIIYRRSINDPSA